MTKMKNNTNYTDLYNLKYGINCERNIKKAIKICKHEIINKNTDAMVELADIYWNDIDVEFNLDRIIKLYTKAIDLGNTHAMIRLAQIFSTKIYDRYNPIKSLELLELAVANNNPCAMIRLAYLYENGFDVPCDLQKMNELQILANKLYMDRISYDSHAMLGYAHSNQYGLNIIPNKNMAIQLYQNAFDTNNIHGLLGLANIYLKDNQIDKYLECLNRAKKMGNFKAIMELADFYLEGPLIYYDSRKAMDLYILCIKKKHPLALYNFASLCKKHNESDLFLKYYFELYNCSLFDANLGVDLYDKNIAWNKFIHKWLPYENTKKINDIILTILLISKFRQNSINNKFLIKGIALLIIEKICNAAPKNIKLSINQ